MKSLITPPVAEVVNTSIDSLEAAAGSLRKFYEISGEFNYLSSTKVTKQAYKGLHNLRHLLAAFDKPGVGVKPNRDVVELAAPLAFGRATQVFDLPPRKFAFGKNRLSSYRLPFFFVESGVVKAYFLLPRKGPYMSYDSICGYATIIKTYLLEQEFFGESIDLEIVDVSSRTGKSPRECRVYKLSDLNLWTEARLQNHLRVVSMALDRLELEGIEKNKRRRYLKDAELPLFD